MKRFLTRMAIFFIAFSTPFVSHASLVSFVSNLFHQKANAETIEPETVNSANSQTIEILHAAVNINPNLSKGPDDIAVVGGSALLAEAGPSGTIADIEDGHSSGQISIYVVQKGDSLSKIAHMFDVSVSTITSANDIKGGVIKEGQTLIILPISGVQYKIKQGDTLKGIITKYKADLEEVLAYNNLTEDSILNPGDEIVIPDVELLSPDTSSASAPKTTTTTTTSKVKGANAPSYPGYYIRPIVGGVKTQGLHGYNGVDLANVLNTPIHAAASGTVIVAITGGWNYGYGNYVVISHPNGTQTLYAHANKVLVSKGDHVNQGQTIALMGSTGNSTGPHVHFEIRGAKNPF